MGIIVNHNYVKIMSVHGLNTLNPDENLDLEQLSFRTQREKIYSNEEARRERLREGKRKNERGVHVGSVKPCGND